MAILQQSVIISALTSFAVGKGNSSKLLNNSIRLGIGLMQPSPLLNAIIAAAAGAQRKRPQPDFGLAASCRAASAQGFFKLCTFMFLNGNILKEPGFEDEKIIK